MKIRNLLIIVPTVILQAVIVVFIHMGNKLGQSTCDTTYAEEIYSPDKIYIVQASDMNCGATVAYIGDVMLYEQGADKTKPNGNMKNIFAYNGTKNDVEILWIDNKTLKIIYRNCREIHSQDKLWKDISIVYENQCEENFSK